MEIVPLTQAHMEAIGGPPSPQTFWGLAVVDGERVMGVTGLYVDAGCLVLVSRIADEARQMLEKNRGRKMLMQAAHRVLELAAERDLPVHALADPAISGSVNLLEHLGFTHYVKETYRWQTR